MTFNLIKREIIFLISTVDFEVPILKNIQINKWKISQKTENFQKNFWKILPKICKSEQLNEHDVARK